MNYFEADLRFGFPQGEVYKHPVALIAKDDRLAKSPVLIITEARGGDGAKTGAVQGSGTTASVKEHQAVSMPTLFQ